MHSLEEMEATPECPEEPAGQNYSLEADSARLMEVIKQKNKAVALLRDECGQLKEQLVLQNKLSCNCKPRKYL